MCRIDGIFTADDDVGVDDDDDDGCVGVGIIDDMSNGSNGSTTISCIGSSIDGVKLCPDCRSCSPSKIAFGKLDLHTGHMCAKFSIEMNSLDGASKFVDSVTLSLFSNNFRNICSEVSPVSVSFTN